MDLSIFVDESGDFDLKSKHSPYYIFTLVFHNQDADIKNDILKLDRHILEKKYEKHAIHTAPLIRKEKPYENYNYEERKILFSQLYFFSRECKISYHAFIFEKKKFINKEKLISKMAQELGSFIKEKHDYYLPFNKIKVYYDNGQSEISSILLVSLSTLINDIDFRKVKPIDYKLFQVADLICTLNLIKIKLEKKENTKWELALFTTKEWKTMIKTIAKKEI